MRAAPLLLLVLAPGCTPGDGDDSYDGYDDDYYDDAYADDGWTGPDDGALGGCTTDDACATGETCARDGACYDPAVVHAVRVLWTIHGEPAGAATCDAYAPALEINFHSPYDSMRFLPVPCHLGRFTIDKLPLYFDTVQLGPRDSAALRGALILGPGDVLIDLP